MKYYLLNMTDETENWNNLLNDFEMNEEENIYEMEDIDDINLEQKINMNDKIKINLCPLCNIKGKIMENVICCPECGMELSLSHDNNKNYSNDSEYNTSQDAFMPIIIVGNNSGCYNKNLLKTTANYSSYRKNSNRKGLHSCNYYHDGKKLPKTCINLALKLFNRIIESKDCHDEERTSRVYRGNSKKGVMGSCLYYACNMYNITKTPKQIASIMGIEERFLSQGDRKVRSLADKGIIDIPPIIDPVEDYLNQYFASLKIDLKYKQFIIDLINRAEKKNIHIESDSKITTKCVGSIYLLSKRMSDVKHIKEEDISRECNGISKTTYNKYYKLLMQNKDKLIPVFIKHRIKMPRSWMSSNIKT